MSDAGQCPTCGGDCGTGDCESLSAADAGAQADGFDDWDDEPCHHEHDEWCEDFQGFSVCSHQHCWNCGGCGCPGYCDDHETYNLRPAETGAAPAEAAQ
jgi:hypothetical protein